MKRFHVNISVSDLQKSVRFYEQLFAQEPTTLKNDYAKWMLDDPKINFSLTTHGSHKGIDHIGLQSEDKAEFEELRERLHEADMSTFEQPDVTCCYAQSSKSWVRDPDNVAWETFVSLGDSSVYDDGSETTSHRFANSEVSNAETASAQSDQSRCCG